MGEGEALADGELVAGALVRTRTRVSEPRRRRDGAWRLTTAVCLSRPTSAPAPRVSCHPAALVSHTLPVRCSATRKESLRQVLGRGVVGGSRGGGCWLHWAPQACLHQAAQRELGAVLVGDKDGDPLVVLGLGAQGHLGERAVSGVSDLQAPAAARCLPSHSVPGAQASRAYGHRSMVL